MTDWLEPDAGSVRCSFAIQEQAGSTAPIRVLRVAGEIDLASCSALEAALEAALFGAVDRPITYLVIDLAGVTFCSARGHAVLHTVGESARRAGIGYALAGLSPHLTRIVTLWTGEPGGSRTARR